MIGFSELGNLWWSWNRNQPGRNSRRTWQRQISFLCAYRTWV